MTNAARFRKRSLECLRLESACTQLAARIPDPALQLHFTRMAQVWNGLAEDRLAEDELADDGPVACSSTDRLAAPRAL